VSVTVVNRRAPLRATAWCGLAVLAALIRPATVNAQAPGQLWGTATVRWLATDRLSFRVQLEPEAQLIVPDDQRTFVSVDATPRVLYVVAPWIDVLGEIDWGIKHESHDVDTDSVTPRFGVQLHILSTILDRGAQGGASRERHPRRRVNFRSLLRFEDQREKSSSDSTVSSSWQFRARFNVAYPLNRPKTTSTGAIYLTADSEAFVQLDDGVLNQLRVRSGIGYRHSFPWGFEALYITSRERTDSGAWATQYHALDLRVQYLF
jgi:hypothetical protein